ncbi:phosphatase family protein-like protein [Macrophomina phaseolina]|uniref:Phosphatase family protein-like protein n=1 Tax=Macrophomina phaseolina TaxID=35725 RepID=A0ABQ8GBC5_9PEZI|nr:phosphatase family protein-like protein [Macrophomina phaseolina]
MSSDTSSTPDLEQSMPGAFPSAAPAPSSTPQSLWQAIHQRRHEYVRPKEIRIKVGTWNVAAFKGTEKDLAGWFVGGKGVEEALSGLGVSDPNHPQAPGTPQPEDAPREGVAEQEARHTDKESTLPKNDHASVPADDDIALYVLGLQEVVDISSATEALRPYTDPATAAKYKAALQYALPAGYQLVAEQQLVGLLLLVYASPSVAPEVRSVSTTSVGTGLMGYMGNKGATTARIVLGETTRLVFINSHLAAGAEKASLDRRNWDAAQIISRTKFDPVTDPLGVAQGNSEGIGDEDFAFWFGDLNYRLGGMPGEDVRRILMLHTRNEYDLSQRQAEKIDKEQTSSTDGQVDEEPEEIIPAKFDPASLQATIESLLPHDELRQQQRQRKAFYDGWREGEIEFLPTYKYDVGTVGIFDSSEKRRCPSWCDRILYRTRRDRLAYYDKIKEEEEAKKKDEEMKKQGLDKEGDNDVLFEYDPETDGDFDYDETTDARDDPIPVLTKDGFEDEIELEYYTAHQRVLSSDHKPLDAVFRLKYDSVVPELKAKVHADVARELDRAENEGRPGVTLIIEKDQSKKEKRDDSKTDFEGVDFGNVKYLETRRRHVTVANTGQVPATISFFGTPGEENSEVKPPSWLTIRFDRDPDQSTQANLPASYTLEPGDACNIDLILKVEDMNFVRELNSEKAQLEDILVLRVSDGRDHFLQVRASWLQSSFGRSIDKLIRIPEGGIRKLQGQRPEGNSSSPSNDAGVKWSAPRELFRLTEVLEDLVERVIAEWDMTDHEEGVKAPWLSQSQLSSGGGWPFAQETWTVKDAAQRDAIKCAIIDALDQDTPLEAAFEPETSTLLRVECLAETMVLFLRSLEDGVVTEELWAKIDAGYEEQGKSKKQLSREEERTWVLEIMAGAPNHNVCFVLLTSMLGRIANEVKNATKVEAALKGPASPLRRTLTGVAGRVRSASEAQKVQALNVEKGLSNSFADVIVRLPEKAGLKDKDKATRRQRMGRIVELFVLPDEK